MRRAAFYDGSLGGVASLSRWREVRDVDGARVDLLAANQKSVLMPHGARARRPSSLAFVQGASAMVALFIAHKQATLAFRATKRFHAPQTGLHAGLQSCAMRLGLRSGTLLLRSPRSSRTGPDTTR